MPGGGFGIVSIRYRVTREPVAVFRHGGACSPPSGDMHMRGILKVHGFARRAEHAADRTKQGVQAPRLKTLMVG